MQTVKRRWSDDQVSFFPFTYSKDKWRSLTVVIGSGDEENPGCNIRFSGFGRTLIIELPPIVRPWREKVYPKTWDFATVARLGRDWYWNVDEREYGFSLTDGFLSVRFGRQSHDSSTEQAWGYFLPWTQWRYMRTSYYGLGGEHLWTQWQRDNKESGFKHYEKQREAKAQIQKRTFSFFDFDQEFIEAKTMIEEREWHWGEGWFKWLSWFRPALIRRSLDIEFSKETGPRKGSWKGGTLGHGIEMLPGELHEAAFRRYCVANNMRFVE